jgi:hypothetical protein
MNSVVLIAAGMAAVSAVAGYYLAPRGSGTEGAVAALVATPWLVAAGFVYAATRRSR